jgi:serine/threonine protein kinase
MQTIHILQYHTIVYLQGCSRELPKNGPSWHSIRKGFLPKLSNMSTELYNILISMINPDPAKRPSAADLLHHPVLRPNHMSKAQLKQQLNEQRFQNQILVK